MRKVGIREGRQNLSLLIDEVKKGREIHITERGKVVARLGPARHLTARPFSGLGRFRRTMPVLDPPLSSSLIVDREDRL